MTQIDFYILNEQAGGNRHLLACRLAEKAWQKGHRVYLHTGSDAEARQLDTLLWTYQDGSFVPHGILGEAEPESNPVLIGWSGEGGNEHDVLVNLAAEIPPFFSRFERVLEPLDQDPAAREAGRARYRYYRDRGYPLNNHQISR
ncbi:MAG: DNA polymerase III subunit chi [Gammaproteobacteria bacterium]|nr:DNA polymerase III subunit chi [Gammaproteobacteria bacterium]